MTSIMIHHKQPPPRLQIIGGGVAGLFLGLLLRRAHVPVSILERDTYPRHRVCGEFMAGNGEGLLKEAGITFSRAVFPGHRQTHWYSGGRSSGTFPLPRRVLGVSRFHLDATLARAFADAGGELITKCRVPRKQFGMEGMILAHGRRARPSPWIGLKAHYTGLNLPHGLQVHLGHQAYVGLSAVENGRTNVCGLFRRRPVATARREANLGTYLKTSDLGNLADFLETGTMDPASFCGVSALSFTFPTTAPGTIAIGDHFGVIPPFTGDGMSLALQSASEAAPILIQYALGKLSWAEAARIISRRHHKAFGARFRWARLIHPWLLQPGGQSLLRTGARMGLIPFRSLYERTHAPLS